MTKLLAVVVLMTASCSSAYSDVLEQTRSTGPASGSAAFDRTLTFNRFDPALGTLNAIRMMQIEVVSADFDMRNDSGSSSSVAARLYGLVNYSGPGFEIDSLPPFPESSPRWIDLSGTGFALAGQVINVPVGAETLTQVLHINNPATVPLYVGSGTFSVSYGFSLADEIVPSDRFSTAANFRSSVTTTLSYEFTPCVCEKDGVDGVDIEDLLMFLSVWLLGESAADVNANAVIDIIDLLEFLECWFNANAVGECS